MTAGGPTQVPARAAAAIIAGISLLAVWWGLDFSLPRGAQEFAYAPTFIDQWPFDPMRGLTVEQAARHAGWTFLVGLALALLAFGVYGAGAAVPTPTPTADLARKAGLFGVLCTTILLFVLGGRPIVDDENAYAMQARLFASGQLADASIPEVPHEKFVVQTAKGWTGKYLPGEPLVQTLGVGVGLPALAHIPLFALTLWAWYLALRREAGERVAAASTVLVALSPMVIATTATGLSHTAHLASMAVALLGLAQVRGDRPWSGAALVAAGVGFGLWVRPQSAVPFGGVLALLTVITLARRRTFGPLLVAAGVGAVFVGGLGLYNAALTGSPTTLPWSLQSDAEHWGLGRVWTDRDYVHTPLKLLQNSITQVVRLNQWAFGSPWSLTVIAAWWVAGRPRAGLSLLVGPTLGLLAFTAGWYSPGIGETGPVYWFEVIFLLALLGGHAWVGLLERWPRQAAIVLTLHVALATFPFLAMQGARMGRLIDAIHGRIDTILADAPRPLLVVYEVQPGENRRIGWLFGTFPRTAHSGPVVYYGDRPRPEGQRPYLNDVHDRYPDRACLYIRANPDTFQWEGQPCATAGALMNRPIVEQPHGIVASTALRLGWLKLDQPFRVFEE